MKPTIGILSNVSSTEEQRDSIKVAFKEMFGSSKDWEKFNYIQVINNENLKECDAVILLINEKNKEKLLFTKEKKDLNPIFLSLINHANKMELGIFILYNLMYRDTSRLYNICQRFFDKDYYQISASSGDNCPKTFFQKLLKNKKKVECDVAELTNEEKLMQAERSEAIYSQKHVNSCEKTIYDIDEIIRKRLELIASIIK